MLDVRVSVENCVVLETKVVVVVVSVVICSVVVTVSVGTMALWIAENAPEISPPMLYPGCPLAGAFDVVTFVEPFC
jgi:hypothetical protein